MTVIPLKYQTAVLTHSVAAGLLCTYRQEFAMSAPLRCEPLLKIVAADVVKQVHVLPTSFLSDQTVFRDGYVKRR